MNKVPLIFVFAMVSALAIAQDSGNYECSMNGMVRRIAVFHEPGVTVPCEVHYFKDTEAPGERQVLWSARSEAGYCEARAAEFAEKLGGMGWTCRSTAADEGPAETDDTDALAPAEEDIEIPESDTP